MASREDPVLGFSTTLSIAVVLGLLTLGLLPLIPGTFLNEIIREPLSEKSDGRPHQVAASPRTETWTDDEIGRAREECMHVLKSISAEIDFLDPIKSSTCGLPAPVRLRSLGSSSRIVFDPPVETNCRLMGALYRWTVDTLQPEAKKSYKSTISRIVGSSAYSCRNIYFLPTGNLSQHAFANAIDIGAFELADGRMITILKGWGPTARDATMLAKRPSKPVQSKSATAGDKNAPKTTYAAVASNQHIAKASLPIKPAAAAGAAQSVVSRTESDRDTARVKRTAATVFLRNLHKGACR
ncbi:MAG: extensin-like domain-containing protein, partial [Candidatus Binatia bacterium]